MFMNVELMVDEKLIRGDVRTPEGDGPFPTVCFYHGFCVDRIGLMRLHVSPVDLETFLSGYV